MLISNNMTGKAGHIVLETEIFCRTVVNSEPSKPLREFRFLKAMPE